MRWDSDFRSIERQHSTSLGMDHLFGGGADNKLSSISTRTDAEVFDLKKEKTVNHLA